MNLIVAFLLGLFALYGAGYLIQRHPWTGLIMGPALSIWCTRALIASDPTTSARSDGSPAAWFFWLFQGLYQLFLVSMIIMGLYILGKCLMIIMGQRSGDS